MNTDDVLRTQYLQLNKIKTNTLTNARKHGSGVRTVEHVRVINLAYVITNEEKGLQFVRRH